MATRTVFFRMSEPPGSNWNQLQGKVALLNEMVLTGGIFNAVKVRLFTNNILLTDLTGLADLTVPSWSGYTNNPVEWEDAFTDGTFGASCTATDMLFSIGTGAGDTVYGCSLVDTAGTELYISTKLDVPYPSVEGEELQIVPVLMFD
jgi:hypothetical protein